MDYEAREVLEHTGITRNQLVRWTDAGIIQPAWPGDGKGSRRRYNLRNLIAVVVCDRLARLGVTEMAMRRVVEVLEYTWSTWSVQSMWHTQKHVLWLRIGGAHQVRRYDARIDEPSIRDGKPNRSAPLLQLVALHEVAGELQQGHFGLALPLREIIRDLEQKTGETLA
jgi:hypothetical protein